MDSKSIDEICNYNKRQAITVQQLEVLLNFVQKHPAAADGRGKEAAARAQVLWAECARQLNRAGPARSGLMWRKVWTDLKSKVKTKIRANGGVDSLTPLEHKLLNVLNNLNPSNFQPKKIPNFEEQVTVASTSDKNEFEYVVLEEFVLENDTLQETFALDSTQNSPAPSPKELKPSVQDPNEQESEESAAEPDNTDTCIEEVHRNKRVVNTIEQLNLLSAFMQKHPILCTDQGRRCKESAARAKVLWVECARLLNRAGPARPSLEWRKVWNDLTSRVRTKIRANGVDSLTPLEQKILNVLKVNRKPPRPNKPEQREFEYEVLDEFVVENETLQESLALDSSSENPLEPSFEPRSKKHKASASTSSKGPKPYKNNLKEQELEESAAEPDKKSYIDRTHAALLKIEQTRAEAELRHAQALASFAVSFRLIAESVDRFTRKCCED